MNYKFIYKNFGLIFVFLSLFLSSSANGGQDLFSEANLAYRHAEFEKAYELYQRIPEKSAYVNYNLGNCAYKLEKYGYAMLYWKRAERDWNFWSKQELLDNIYLLRKKLHGSLGEDKANSFSYYKVKNILVSFVRYIPTVYLQFMFLAFWVFLFLYIRRLYKAKKKILISLLFCSIVLFGSLLVVKYGLENRVCGIVTSGEAPLLSGPGNSFHKIGTLPQASEFFISRESGDFYKVKFYKQIGWINKKDSQKI